MEKECRLCSKNMLCDKNKKETCEKYEKEPYTTIIKRDGIKKIERI